MTVLEAELLDEFEEWLAERVHFYDKDGMPADDDVLDLLKLHLALWMDRNKLTLVRTETWDSESYPKSRSLPSSPPAPSAKRSSKTI